MPNSFSMHLQSPSQYERVDNVTSFVGFDLSGSFGILPGHERMITVLQPGIACLHIGREATQFLGLSSGVLYFIDNELFISTLRYLRSSNHSQLHRLLRQQVEVEEQELAMLAETVRKMEESLLRRLIRQPEEMLP